MILSRWTALLLLAAPLAAQLDEKAATAQFKVASKVQLKDFKEATTPLKQTLMDAIEAFEDELPGAVDPFATAETLAQALQTYHTEMRNLLLELSVTSAASWQQALSDFANGVPLNGIYPEGLVSGDGGPVDDLRAAVKKHLVKLAVAINKRLDKAEKAAEKEGFGLLAWSGTPSGLVDTTASEALSVGASPPLSIDVLLSLSELDVAADGRLWIGGTSTSGKLPVTVTVTSGLETIDSGSLAVNSTLVWLLPLDGEGAGVTEGNVIVLADVDGVGAIATASFGIR